MAQPEKVLQAKIVMAGDSCVGKSSILRRYAELGPAKPSPPTSYITTVGIDFKVKTISVNGTAMKLQIWDTAGQERFHTFTTSFFRGAHGFVLVYDITSTESFQGIAHWMKDINEGSLGISFPLCYHRLAVGVGSGELPELYGMESEDRSLHQANRNVKDLLFLGLRDDRRKLIKQMKTWRYYCWVTSVIRRPNVSFQKTEGKSLLGNMEYPFFETSAKDNINIEDAFLLLAKEILNKNSHDPLDLDVVDLNEKTRKRSCCKL